jgi:phytoene synthase
LASSSDLAACASSLSGGSRTFHAASLLLPRRVRRPAVALYAFCRLADDIVDGGDADGVASLRQRIDLAYRGAPLPFAEDRALSDVVTRFAIPRLVLEAMLEGFAWDAAGRRYETLEDLCGYAARVAGTVGAMMAILMERRAPHDVSRACDLGIAMQLTNIARDVGEDARAGRLYLPLQWLRLEGIDPDAWLARPSLNAGIEAVVQRLLDSAEHFYRRADAGIARLPRDCRPGIRAARLLYAEIGRAVERNGCDSVSQRARVPLRRKLALLARAVGAPRGRGETAQAPATAQAAFLVAAVGRTAPRTNARPGLFRALEARFVWVLDLFERLERLDEVEPV